jgi:hypothetical protein
VATFLENVFLDFPFFNGIVFSYRFLTAGAPINTAGFLAITAGAFFFTEVFIAFFLVVIAFSYFL